MNEKTAQKICITICICTFRRPHIIDTLHSVLKLHLEPQWDVRVIVADNDDIDSARNIVESIAKESKIPINYIHAPARNISIARNACLDAVTTPLVAFIDDDELVTNGWLKAMLGKLYSSNADAVLGAVQAIYNPKCKDWLRKGDFHSTYPVWVGDEIITGYSCNVLIKRTSPILQELRFRKDLGRSGGEDTAYFHYFHKAGGVIAFASDAIVTEAVTPEREKFSWLLKRRFRSGQTHALLLIENNGNNIYKRMVNIINVIIKLSFCFIMALINFLRPVEMRFWLLRGALHVGVIARLFGKQEIVQYG